MIGSAPSSRRTRPPWGLIGALGLVLAVEAFVTSRRLDLIGVESWEWARSSRLATQQGLRNQILVFGSSVSCFGLLPPLIQQQVGKTAFNFGLCGGPAPANYFLLRRALAAGAKPSAIVVDFLPGPLGRPTWWSFVRLWPELLTTRECLELSWSAGDSDFFAENVLASHLPSIKDRLRIRTSVLAAFRGESSSQRATLMAFRRNKTLNKGALLQPLTPFYQGEITANYRADLLPEHWSPDPVSARYARRFLDLAAEHKIPVFWVIPPFAPALRAEREAKGLDGAYTRFARRMVDRYPNLVVVSATRSDYDVPAFADAGHLNRQGGITFTTDVAAVLRSRLDGNTDGPRWIDLPRYRAWPSAVPLEDYVQSVAATNSIAVRR